jgi:hypothetical protein
LVAVAAKLALAFSGFPAIEAEQVRHRRPGDPFGCFGRSLFTPP